MECKFCGSEIEDTEIQCPICKQSLIEVKTKIKVRCLISNYETEIDENDNEFYCEKCFSNHIIDGEDFIKVSKTQENENLNKTSLENEIKKDEVSGKNIEKKMIAKCLISNYETEIDENDNEFYCEKCSSNHIIDGEDFIKVSKTQENKNLNRTPLEKEIKEEAIYLILKNNENEIIKIPKIGGNVGRQGDYGARIFEKYYMNKVSRLHFRIEYNSLNEWVIWHLSTTNDTEVNKEKVCSDSPRILKNDDEITLAKEYSFKVKIK